MPAKKSATAGKSAPKATTLFARAAATTPRSAQDNGRQSALCKIPGLYDDLVRTVNAQRKLPPHERLGLAQLHALVRECYPAYRGGYPGFWRWVVAHLDYRAQKELS